MIALYNYFSALVSHWIGYMTGGLFLVDKIIRSIWPDSDARIAILLPSRIGKHITPKNRTRLALTLAIFGVFLANFYAYREEYERAERLAGHAEFRRRILPPEASAIKTHFAGARAVIPLIYICAIASDEAERYATDFWELFKGVGLDAQLLGSCVPRGDNDRGLFVGLRDPDHPSAAATEFIKRLLASGFQIKQTPFWSVGLPPRLTSTSLLQGKSNMLW